MIDLVLVAPEIPGNTGAIIRLCANTGTRLHLVEPLGFSLETAQLRRAGLDYHDLASTSVWPTFSACRDALGTRDGRWYATTSHATRSYTDVGFRADDVVVFGSEADGLGHDVLALFEEDHQLTVPMQPNNRSLNLSNTAAIITYEAWRQMAFIGATGVVL